MPSLGRALQSRASERITYYRSRFHRIAVELRVRVRPRQACRCFSRMRAPAPCTYIHCVRNVIPFSVFFFFFFYSSKNICSRRAPLGAFSNTNNTNNKNRNRTTIRVGERPDDVLSRYRHVGRGSRSGSRSRRRTFVRASVARRFRARAVPCDVRGGGRCGAGVLLPIAGRSREPTVRLLRRRCCDRNAQVLQRRTLSSYTRVSPTPVAQRIVIFGLQNITSGSRPLSDQPPPPPSTGSADGLSTYGPPPPPPRPRRRGSTTEGIAMLTGLPKRVSPTTNLFTYSTFLFFAEFLD